jgi:hypothetical protein
VLSDRNGPYNRGLEISTLLLPAVAVATLTSKDMLPRPRKVRREAAQSRGKENKSVPISDKPVESSQTQKKEPKSHLYLLLVFPIVLLMMLHSLVTFLYIRALNPLYGNVPINLHLDKIIWAATLTGAFGPVPSFWPSFAIQGGLVASIPISSHYIALYAARTNNPSLGSTLTHLMVLFPVLYIGVSLVKRMVVRTRTLFYFSKCLAELRY